jgi:2,3-bisphosphoglycerate-independent phosphoglycerate mutase
MKGGKKQLRCTPPHDVPGTPFTDVMIKAESVAGIQQNAQRSYSSFATLLENHPVNLKRAAAGKDKANSIWPWSPVSGRI